MIMADGWMDGWTDKLAGNGKLGRQIMQAWT